MMVLTVGIMIRLSLGGLPPTCTNRLCEWLVITMKDNELWNLVF